MGKRSTPLQRDAQAVGKLSEKQRQYDARLNTMGKRNSYSKTDHDATFMRMKEDHSFRRFLTRGEKNVRIEMLLMAMGYNIFKLRCKIQNHRAQQWLFEMRIA